MEWSMPPPRCEISPPEKKRTEEMKEKSLVGHQNLRPSVRPAPRAPRRFLTTTVPRIPI